MTVQFDFEGAAATPRDAATVLVVRDAPDGVEVFFVRRSADARFMGGAYVFPGGRLDPGDSDPNIPTDLSPAEAAARLGDDDPARALGLHVAAIRECLEESGILLATEPPDLSTLQLLRRALSTRETPPLAALFAQHGVTLSPRSLRPLSRWITPRAETRRFDARFFVARATAHSELASHDGSETVDSLWLTASDALARARRREIVLAPPTWRTLDAMKHASSVEQVFALCRDAPAAVEPAVVLEGDGPCVVLPEERSDDGISVLANRFLYADGAWIPMSGA